MNCLMLNNILSWRKNLSNLKIFEQAKEIEIIIKQLGCLKDKENKNKDLEDKFEILVKKVDDITTHSQETNSEINVNNDTLENVKK